MLKKHSQILVEMMLADSVFTNLPAHQNLFVALKSILAVLLQSFTNMSRAMKNLSCPTHTFTPN